MSLKKEIAIHIFDRFNIGPNENKFLSVLRDNPISKKFLLKEKISFESDDKKYKNNIWSGVVALEGAKIQFIIADLSEDIAEYCLLIKMDSFPPYAIRISSDSDDEGTIFFKINGKDDAFEEQSDEVREDIGEKWIDASPLFQAKILMAVESLMEIFVSWDKNDEYNDIHKDLISFLKFESENTDE